MCKKILTILLLFIFNITQVDSNSNKYLLYDNNDIYNVETFKIYFVNTNSIELNNALNNLDIEIYSYIIDDKNYYVRNINELEKTILENKSLYENIYYSEYGIHIDGIICSCSIKELERLNKLIPFY